MNVQDLTYTEHNIECWVERCIDSIDLQYMTSQLTEEEYRAKIDEIYAQAERMYAIPYFTDDSDVYEL